MRPELAIELNTGLPVFWRFRQAVQASYFAWRVSANVQTGLTTDDGNQIGLADAQRWFTAN